MEYRIKTLIQILTKKYDNTFAFALVFILTSLNLYSNDKQFEIKASKYLLSTKIDAIVISNDIQKSRIHLAKAFLEIERIQNLLSSYISTSEIYKINSNAGLKPIKVSPECFEIIERSIKYSQKYEGLFDISIGPLVEIWGFNSDSSGKIPNSNILDSLKILVNYKNIILDQKDTSVFLKFPGMRLDLGGVAKGYALDRAVAKLKAQGESDFLINAGGDVFSLGLNKDKTKWNIGIKHPRIQDSIIAKLSSSSYAITSSGDYERYFEKDGKRFHHILDPFTAYPNSNSIQVSLLTENAEEGTVLDKYIFMIGFDKFKILQKNNKYFENLKYIVVDKYGKIYYSEYFEKDDKLQIFK
jgi:thiamine biosynthesis lipoprotein